MRCRLVNNHNYLLDDTAEALNQQGLCENIISRGVFGSESGLFTDLLC
jgi:hypothetical protein